MYFNHRDCSSSCTLKELKNYYSLVLISYLLVLEKNELPINIERRYRMKHTLYYLVYYDQLDKKIIRHVSPATVTKASYVSKAITEIGFHVQIVSPAVPSKKGKYKGSNDIVMEGVKLKLFSSFFAKTKVYRILRRILLKIRLTFYFLFFVKRKSTIIVYHSLSLMRFVKFLKAIKQYKVIYEVNEIYGDVINNSKISQKEIKLVSKTGDAFMFPTEMMLEKININSKLYAINYGSYTNKTRYNFRFNDDKIHCVYSGTLSLDKGGSAAAAAASLYLDERYHIHILGFGSTNEIESIKQTITNINSKTKCKVTYEGVLYDEDFDKFLQKCKIGLSTQTLDNNFNNTSFPSKILTYLGNGLKVVSIKIEPVYNSLLKDSIVFYDEDNPQEIAKAIKKVDLTNDSAQSLLEELDVKFKNQFKSIVSKFTDR